MFVTKTRDNDKVGTQDLGQQILFNQLFVTC